MLSRSMKQNHKQGISSSKQKRKISCLWNDVRCELKGKGMHQVISMKDAEGTEITVLPHNMV
jgi:hypothetical protein